MNIGFLLSGSGSTLQNFIDLKNKNKFFGSISVVISSKKEAYGLKRAKKANIPAFIVEYKHFKNDVDSYSKKISKILKDYDCDLIVMGGFMSFYKVPKEFENKVLNVHPSLIPSFCGKGMYGEKVHKAVLEYGVKFTGCTVHLVNNEYDKGPIVAQGIVEVFDDDTEKTLSQKVQAKERELYPEIVNNFINGLYEVKEKKVFKKKI